MCVSLDLVVSIDDVVVGSNTTVWLHDVVTRLILNTLHAMLHMAAQPRWLDPHIVTVKQELIGHDIESVIVLGHARHL